MSASPPALVLEGTRLLHYTQQGDRTKKIKQEAWKRNGAQIVDNLEDATHVIVGTGQVHIETGLPVLRESWVSDCIESKRVLGVEGYQWLKRQRADVPTSSGASGSGSCSNSPSHPVSSPHKAARKEAFSFNNLVADSIPNQHIIDFFHELASQRGSAGKEFSKRAYERAIAALEDIPIPLTSASQAAELMPQVFRGHIKTSLDALLEKKIPPKALQKMRQKSQTLANFQAAIYGVGAKRALEFYNMGCRTLQDVRSATSDPRMIASIDHSNDLLQRISRSEVEKHFAAVTEVVHELDANAETLCMGSYRREKPDCGDIDIIITKPHASKETVMEITRATIDKLFERKIATFTFGGDGSHRWLGATQLPDYKCWRRMDLLSVKYEELGAAMCYYTGSDMFNRCMRFRAQKIGMQLNETGLYTRETNVLLESASEVRIFEKLGIEWREPRDRGVEGFKLVGPEG